MKMTSGLGIVFLVFSVYAQANQGVAPNQPAALEYAAPLLSGNYDPSLATPEQLLGFPVGSKTATPAQIAHAVETWTQGHARARLVEYARSHEHRPLYYVIISAPQNITRLDAIESDLAALANAADTSSEQAQTIIERLPAVAWMAYSIHGNESSGADASLAAIYHLLASRDPAVADLLDKMVVIIDPSMNPDGRARFVRQLEQARMQAPNVDDQSLLHSGTWPYGRTNHYLFDLNRDFLFQVHPETRGRVAAINRWRPQLLIDGHEMGSQATYLFSPSREPVNKNLSTKLKAWGPVFASAQAQAFDRYNWPYYTGEWFENLYAGYSSYAEFRGAIHILYEQARVAEDGVSRADGSVLTYAEAVHHQLISTLVNLQTLAEHSKEIYGDYFADRQLAISTRGPFANRSYVLLPSANHSRLHALIGLIQSQGIEVYTTREEVTVDNALDYFGQTHDEYTLPQGSVVIPNRQAEARLAATMLEFDTDIDDAVLLEERQSILRDNSSIMYDVTAWSLPLMYGIETLTVPTELSGLAPYTEAPPPQATALQEQHIAYIADGADDLSLALAAQLMEQGIAVRVIDQVAQLGGQDFSRGSVVVYRYDNRQRDNLAAEVATVANKLGITVDGISDGLGPGALPDIGGRHFRLLQRPSVAIVTGNTFNPYDYGAIWHSIDQHLGIRHSHLDQARLRGADLRRYNVLIMPDRGGALDAANLSRLKTWVEGGGTLIAIDGAIAPLVRPESDFSSVRQLSDTFDQLPKYQLSLQREWYASRPAPEHLAQSRGHLAPIEVDYPWADSKPALKEDQLKTRDQWQAMFMPSGAVVAARVDTQHWLSFGLNERLPILLANGPVLMSDDRSKAVLRAGIYRSMSEQAWRRMNADGAVPNRVLGWSQLPPRQELVMRLSGVLWPEASQRLANSALLTREAKGNGQIILFAAQPNFRGGTKGSNRLLLNAIVYGPGLGARGVIKPH